jgi:hypothetical protein
LGIEYLAMTTQTFIMAACLLKKYENKSFQEKYIGLLNYTVKKATKPNYYHLWE